jgi:hypothetical protein
LPDPLVYDASPRALRQRTVNFAAKRVVDMRYVSGLDRATAERHFRWRPAVAPGGLGFRAAPDGQAELVAAHRRGDIVIDMDDADRRVTVHWNDASFSKPVIGSAIAPRHYGGTVVGTHAGPQFDPQPISRRLRTQAAYGPSAMPSKRRQRRRPASRARACLLCPRQPSTFDLIPDDRAEHVEAAVDVPKNRGPNSSKAERGPLIAPGKRQT